MWFLWLERNECTFRDTPFRTANVIWRVNLQLERLILGGILTSEHWKGVQIQHPLLAGRRPKRRMVRAVRINWIAPEDNWIKVNTDGAFSTARNRAGGGGLIRNPEGKLITAFSSHLQAESSLEAELKAFDLGISAAARYGENIWIETDAATIVHMITQREYGPASVRHIIGGIKHKISNLNVKVSYIAREGNKPADFLAARGLEEQGMRFFDQTSAPARLRALVELDEKGIPNFRFHTSWTSR